MQFKNKKARRLVKWLSGVILLGILITGGASVYLINFAFNRNHVTPSHTPMLKMKAVQQEQPWLKEVPHQLWHEKSAVGNLSLVADFVPAAKKTNKTILVVHGYKESYQHMVSYIKMFHQLGYNVLAPDNQGCGHSGGKYLTFGWYDRLNNLKWIQQLLRYQGPQAQIGLFGLSMGGATVMMMSGEHLPAQVKAIVEDSGYSSIEQELTDQLQANFHLPKYPLIPSSRLAGRLMMGFDYGKGSSIDALHHNHLPMMFIHGAHDHFVKTSMVKQNYQATGGPKQLWITQNQGHAMSYYSYPKIYQQKVGAFFAQYLH